MPGHDLSNKWTNFALGHFKALIGIVAIGIAIWAYVEATNGVVLVATCILGWMLLALAVFDMRYMRLPDALTLPLIPIGILTTNLIHPDDINSHILGVLFGYALFRIISNLFFLIKGYEGLGRGDAKLLAVAGAWVGWELIPNVVALAAGLGLAAVGTMRIFGRFTDRETRLPFGPCLALALWIIRENS